MKDEAPREREPVESRQPLHERVRDLEKENAQISKDVAYLQDKVDHLMKTMAMELGL